MFVEFVWLYKSLYTYQINVKYLHLFFNEKAILTRILTRYHVSETCHLQSVLRNLG